MLRHALEGHGHAVVEARDEVEAKQRLAAVRPTIVLSDLRLPHGDGFGVLRAVKEQDSETPVIVMTAYGSIEDAVAAMKEGALDFLAKPVDPEHLRLLVARAIEQRQVVTENVALKEELVARRGMPNIIGDDPKLGKILATLARAARTDTTVLLEGESGTGKELFARALHTLSPRAERPFVAINCAAIPDALLESELFGHEKGAFTGAVARKLGKFEVADRGTLFLDEIGDLPMGLQAKILRALEERCFDRLGGTTERRVDVRIVAATNKRLLASVAAKQFREDLYFRLSVFPVVIPPLRERSGDVPLLARHFIDRFCADLRKPRLTLSPAAAAALQAYAWPGNVRELQNCIERAVILTDGDTIRPPHLNLSSVPPGAGDAGADASASPWAQVDLSGSLTAATDRITAEVEHRKIQQALQAAGGRRTEAAAQLEVSPKALAAMIKKYAIGAPASR